jgi:hypothetical protein
MAYPNESGLGLMNPIAQIGHNVRVLYDTFKYYKVTFFEPIPPFQALDLGAIAANANTQVVPAGMLDLDPDEFAQYRWWPLDNAQIYLYVPSSNGRFNLKNQRVPVDMNIIRRDPDLHFTEFFQWQDKRANFQAFNGAVALAQCRIIVMGFRFHGSTITDQSTIDGIEAGTIPCVKIVAQGQVS